MNSKKKRRNENQDSLVECEENSEENNISYQNLLSELNELNISNSNSNKLMLSELLKKINIIEKKVDELNKINLKVDALQKNLDKILIEKDYTIENLHDQITDLKSEIREKNYSSEDNSNKKINDYFY